MNTSKIFLVLASLLAGVNYSFADEVDPVAAATVKVIQEQKKIDQESTQKSITEAVAAQKVADAQIVTKTAADEQQRAYQQPGTGSQRTAHVGKIIGGINNPIVGGRGVVVGTETMPGTAGGKIPEVKPIVAAR